MSLKKKLLLIGGGGHCLSVLDTLLDLNIYDNIGIVDPERTEKILSTDIVGSDQDLPRLFECGWTSAFVTVGSIGDPKVRIQIYDNLKKIGFQIPTIIDRTAVVSSNAHLKEGCFVAKNAIINAGSEIGVCSIINSAAIVEHECVLGDFVHICPGTVLSGQVKIGNKSHIGSNSVIRQQIVIGESVVVGIGSVVVKDIPGGVTVCGNPCKVL